MNSKANSLYFYSSPKKWAGATLIELMVSLTIGLIIVAAIGYIYLGSKESFTSQEALSRMQEGARITFEIIGKDLRMVGFTGCPRNTDAAAGDANMLVNGTANWYTNLYDRPFMGYEKPSGYPWSSFPVGVTGVIGSVKRGDVMTVLHADNANEFIVEAHDPAGTPPQFTLTANHNINQDTILLVAKPNCSRTVLFKNTRSCTINPANSTCDHKLIEHNADSPCSSGNNRKGLGLPVGACPDGTPYTFEANSRIYRLSAVTYYLKDNPEGETSLYREKLNNSATEAEEMVEGVADMQLVYGVDTNANGTVDEYYPANDVYFTGNPANWQNVLSVRISLLMESHSDDKVTTKSQSYSIDMNGDGDVADADETVTPAATDRRLRKLFTTTIAIKNRL